MTVIFISNYFDHHAKPLSDALDTLTGGEYIFLGSEAMTQERVALGWGNIEHPYYVKYVDLSNKEDVNKWKDIIASVDIVIYGSAPLSLLDKRRMTNRITFYYAERMFKDHISYVGIIERVVKDFLLCRRPNANTYMLAASAYNPYDFSLLGYFKNRTYRWGYFTECKKYNIEELLETKKKNGIGLNQGISILWAGRLISWKHPEKAILVAEKLKQERILFHLNIVGRGELEDSMRAMVTDRKLNDEITFLGSMPPTEVRHHMENSDIFLFTSDRNEGWGAVLNESMNSGCAVVACEDIGAAPYLIEEGVNGYTYKNDDFEDFYTKVKLLAVNPEERRRVGENAYNSIIETWNAEVAARNLLNLYAALLEGKDTPIVSGPCSKAPIMNNR